MHTHLAGDAPADAVRELRPYLGYAQAAAPLPPLLAAGRAWLDTHR